MRSTITVPANLRETGHYFLRPESVRVRRFSLRFAMHQQLLCSIGTYNVISIALNAKGFRCLREWFIDAILTKNGGSLPYKQGVGDLFVRRINAKRPILTDGLFT